MNLLENKMSQLKDYFPDRGSLVDFIDQVGTSAPGLVLKKSDEGFDDLVDYMHTLINLMQDKSISQDLNISSLITSLPKIINDMKEQNIEASSGPTTIAQTTLCLMERENIVVNGQQNCTGTVSVPEALHLFETLEPYLRPSENSPSEN